MQALILHTSREEILDPLTNNYPLALITVVNKPLVCYQLEYLLAHGIKEIMISCERKYASKIERYLKNFFQAPVSAIVDLVVFQEEEEHANVLRAVEKKVTGDLVVIEGNSLCDVPLDELLDTHRLGKSAITCLLKEVDMSKK